MASGEYRGEQRGEHPRVPGRSCLAEARFGVGTFCLSSRLLWQIVSSLKSYLLRGFACEIKAAHCNLISS